jgi:hypothetical protein
MRVRVKAKTVRNIRGILILIRRNMNMNIAVSMTITQTTPTSIRTPIKSKDTL